MDTEPQKELTYKDRVEVAEIFSDLVRLTHWDGFSARIEFAVSRPRLIGPNQTENTIYPAARLVLSPAAVVALQQQLTKVVSALESFGLLKRLAPSSETKQ